MYTVSEENTKKKLTLAKAVLSASEQLGLTQDQLALTLNMGSVTNLGSVGLDPVSKQGKNALTLIRIAIALNGLMGSDISLMQYFMHSSNKLTGGIPIKQIQNTLGLDIVLQVVEAVQNKV